MTVPGFDETFDVIVAGCGLAKINNAVYLAGGNIAECFVTGRIAGRNAATEARQSVHR